MLRCIIHYTLTTEVIRDRLLNRSTILPRILLDSTKVSHNAASTIQHKPVLARSI